MRKPGIIGLMGGLAAGALVAAAWRIYSRRPRERVHGFVELDDPEVAWAFDRMARTPQFGLLRWYVARRALAMKGTGDAVDLGCGPGHLVLKLAQLAPELRVIGVDLSQELLDRAEAGARRLRLGERVSFRQGDAQQIPFPDGSLDLVVSTLSLHHWSDPVAVLDEVARVLRPGGSFLVFDLRRDLPAPPYLLLWFATHYVVPAALRRVREPLASRDSAYTPDEAAALAKQSRLAGWRVTCGPLWLTVEGQKPPGAAS